ncbi:hypothetical protein [Actinomadura opuntiae]|uniref:hypothetical protein n=1 Tax=Actinomadura sp. OS1-43 TaxID=604315 RepID=UPI00255AE21F|nr:hypothetical protein [Actinomadura sp. OS1-43]MDL4819824.1 hypothetical protein [Actinomadura sp. OS1-43]
MTGATSRRPAGSGHSRMPGRRVVNGAVMVNWRDRVQTTPIWAFFLIVAVLLTVYLDALAVALGQSAHGVLVLSLFALALAAVSAGLAAVRRAWVSKRIGRYPRSAWTEMACAFRTGRPPDDPALDEPLLALIERRKAQRRRLRRQRPAALVLFILWCAASLYLKLLDWRPLLVLIVVIPSVQIPLLRRRRAVDRLLAERIRGRWGWSADGRFEEVEGGGS